MQEEEETETNKSLEELEFSLPLIITRKEPKRMPCPDRARECEIPARYEQRLVRLDDFFNNRHTRRYEIAYKKDEESVFIEKAFGTFFQ
jgi:hypothetical protein